MLESKLNSRLPLSALQGNRTVNGTGGTTGPRAFNRRGEGARNQRRPMHRTRLPAATRSRYSFALSGADDAGRADTRFEAAALTYIPEQFSSQGGLGPAELQAALGTEPFLSGIVEAPIGRVGTFMLPLRAPSCFSSRNKPGNWSSRNGAGIPAGFAGHDSDGIIAGGDGVWRGVETAQRAAFGQPVTTGHALTTATIIANLTDLLRRCGRRLEA